MHETASTSTMHAVRHADRCQSLLRRHIKPCFPVARKHDTLHDELAKTCQRRLPLPRHTDSLTSRSVNAHSPTPSLVHSRPSMTPTAHSAPSGSVGPCHPKHKAPLGGRGGGAERRSHQDILRKYQRLTFPLKDGGSKSPPNIRLKSLTSLDIHRLTTKESLLTMFTSNASTRPV